MEVLDFINSHPDWEEILTQPPYSIKVKRDGDYILLKYNQLNSDFSLPIVRECRGSIFYLNTNGKYICVCRAFDKFGNYGESYVKDVDWNDTTVEEKIDGSLIKVWYHNERYHVSTNGTIDAYKAEVADLDITFGDVFDEALGGERESVEFLYSLDPFETYMFELVSPKSRTTIFYPETKLYYLGQRNMQTMQEHKKYEPFMRDYGVLCPKEYPLHTIEECVEYVQTMTKDEEGFVIKDKNFNRMKLKSPEYLFVFHMNNNGVITTKRIINMIKNEQIDDFLAYCPQYNDAVQNVINDIRFVATNLEHAWNSVSYAEKFKRAVFATVVKHCSDKDFLWERYDNHNLSAFDWVMSRYTSKIKRLIEKHKERIENNRN